MTERFQEILQRYGQTVSLLRAGQRTQVRAFVQRARRTDTKPAAEDGPLGAEDLRRWVYIGPREQALQVDDIVCVGDLRYCVQDAAAVYAGEEQSHWWAILREEREALT